MNAAKLIRQLKKDLELTQSLNVADMRNRASVLTLNFLLDEGLNDLEDYERIRTLKEDLERER